MNLSSSKMEDNNSSIPTENNEPNNLQVQDEQRATITTEEEAAAQDHQDQDEEALSLRGLMLNSDEVEFQDRGKSSSADLSELFEFFSDRNSEMSHAEDMIFCGKLIPYKERHSHPNDHPRRHYPLKNHHFLKHPTRDEKQQSFHRRRSESLNDLRTSQTSSAGHHHQFMRNSRSLDYQKLYGNYSSRWTEKLDMERSTSTKSTGARVDATTGSKEKVPRPRWYMMFGLVKFPLGMDFQDMKSRQVRRNPSTLFTPVDADRKTLVNRVHHRRCSSSWDLLRVLSCKGHASVAVTTPFSYLQKI